MVLDQKLNAGDVIVLDGATGTALARRGVPMDSAAWCGVANQTHPDVVRQVHEDYLRAGADVITANTFATSRHVLGAVGLGDESVAINRRAGELAREARDRSAPERPVAIAGSMSNMRAWAPGSINADTRYVPDMAQQAANFREMADTLAEAGADLIIMEMMFDLGRAKPAITAAVATGLPVWVGMSCTQRTDGRVIAWDITAETDASRLLDDHPPGPEVTLERLIDECMALGGTVAGIMHSTVSATSPGLEMLLERWSGPVMVYPETTAAQPAGRATQSTVSPETFAAHCRQWVDDGAQIIGGCCGTTVEHIRRMADELPKQSVARV